MFTTQIWRKVRMPAAHCVSSIDGIILQADQGFLDLLQRSKGDVIGTSYRQFTDPRDSQRNADMLAVLEEDAAPVRFQKRYLRPDGSSIAANLLVSRFANPDRLISTLFWHDGGRDLAPVRLWEAALLIRHVHDAKGRLFGADLNTDPIGSVLIGIYLAEAEGRAIGLREIATYAGVAISIATRWVALLRQRDFIDNQADVTINIQLTRAGLDQVEAMLASVYEAPNSAVMLM